MSDIRKGVATSYPSADALTGNESLVVMQNGHARKTTTEDIASMHTGRTLVASGTFQNASANTYEDTGLSFTTEAGAVYQILTGFNTARPTGFRLVLSNDSSQYIEFENGTYVMSALFGGTRGAITFKLYSKRASAATSPHTYEIYKLKSV